jgi:hypothetical protein
MAEAMKGPVVGGRLTLIIDGKVEEFVVNRITPSTAGRGRRLVRVQIDAMAVNEVVRRRDSLIDLLDGVATEASDG